uniref:NADH-ubiquinone oxidoreductase chain 6 n=2 Tax=Mauremys TaxID=74925 RepID=G8XSP7_MAURE|nr:NADH dehydrogenase subunit 6 [Mauremys megalocephala]ACJ60530.1 NADH dehydrogenase subunit 6 [Mauremys reevesii]ADG85403.1 NADH dehydrogenase subunit 6 [Mauremys megalocephala]AII40795.1 NADH dehydrogenase subunit 6 [Mauremys reevesii]BBI28588.1 NADH dehydrogenase subunit 6 [Mauremys reevesii]
MMYFMFLFGFCFVFWMVGVSCNPSPYYGVVSLIFGALFGCGVLVGMGGSFVSLVLFLIYLGGMLVIFAYSSALMAEPFPVSWMSLEGVFYGLYYLFIVLAFVMMDSDLWSIEGIGANTVDADGLCVVRLDFGGVPWLYCVGNGLLLIAGWGLLLTLFVVLELIRGLSRGVLRAI